MTIFLGADHRGFSKKQELVDYLRAQGREIENLGAHELNNDDDYNDFAIAVAEAVLKNSGQGILICGSAQGVCMQANRFRGIRAAICESVDEAKTTREHNDANILCLSADKPDLDFKEIVDVFLATDFSREERHKRRIEKLDRF